jgi:uncharacterized protein YkwD
MGSGSGVLAVRRRGVGSGSLTNNTASERPLSRRRGLSLITACALIGFVAGTVVEPPAPASAQAGTDEHDWLGAVNAYRHMSGLEPVTANASWSQGAREHSCYMVRNSTLTHYQDPALPGATPAGAHAGRNGNVAVSPDPYTTARFMIELWLTAPFHAIGMLRPELRHVGYGSCSDTNRSAQWRSAATLNVLDGLTGPRGPRPVVFPGNGARTSLSRFIAESPDPVQLCGWSGAAGLPLIAMLPARVTTATATLRGPGGPEQVCVLHAHNSADPVARSVMASENAVVVVPRNPLGPGSWAVTVASDGGNVNWGFVVDPHAPLLRPGATAPPPKVNTPAPDVKVGAGPGGFDAIDPVRVVDTRSGVGSARLRARKPVMFTLTNVPPGTVAVSLNATAVGGSGPGFVTLYDCADKVPTVSTLNYTAGAVVPNGAVVPVNARRQVCAYAHTDVDLVLDVNGWVTSSSSSGFTPTGPTRIFDSRSNGGRLVPYRTTRVAVSGTAGVPDSASAVSVNVTVVDADRAGFVTVWPCGTPRPAVSNINVTAGQTRANNVNVKLGGGAVCVEGMVGADLVVDVSGFFSPDGSGFTQVSPTRLVDTRDANPVLHAGLPGRPVFGREVVRLKVAGRRGVPGDVRAVVVNVTAVSAHGDGYVTVWACDGPVPSVSTLNYRAGGPPVANGAFVRLSRTGELCMLSHRTAHLVLDVNAIIR